MSVQLEHAPGVDLHRPAAFNAVEVPVHLQRAAGSHVNQPVVYVPLLVIRMALQQNLAAVKSVETPTNHYRAVLGSVEINCPGVHSLHNTRIH